MSDKFSPSPDGRQFPIPDSEELYTDFQRVSKLVSNARKRGDEIVVVMGMGFVGIVMAAIVADAPGKFVIGCQRPSRRSYWKVPVLNSGISPLEAEDPEVSEIIQRTICEKKTFTVTPSSDCISLADCIIVDVQCDYIKNEFGNVRNGTADVKALEETMRTIGLKKQKNALTLIETTVAPGTTEYVALPILREAFSSRGIESEPLLAHSFERVMPGKEYVSSIRDFWRVCSGVNEKSKNRVEKFLREVLNTEDYPLTVMDRPMESETTKIMENSYRATILAFADEWSTFAEINGIDIDKVIKAIKVRPTHSNILFPGPGIGGYCLPKDGGLGYWSYSNILGFDDEIFHITPSAIDINDKRGLRAAKITKEALLKMGKKPQDSRILICGASYRQDVGDTRYSGSEIVIRKLIETGAEISVHDPYVRDWPELENQDSDPHSKMQFFENQETLSDLRISSNLKSSLPGIDAVVLTVPHSPYLELQPDDLFRYVGGPFAMVDCFCILDDHKIRRLFELGCEVTGLGRGHVSRIKESIQGN
tara:strand:+ start:1576 stop:3183 length:1608 start_codon:yes stop_codon:yes gene_type:complete